MLKLLNVTKEYVEGDSKVAALRGVDLEFRENEFVSILGPSGCGKTTLLNIIGGLDKYTDGDLFIDGISTKEYKDGDWDTYRNHSIGFVFQSYNLIPHQSVLSNVELALTLSGVSKAERRKRATEALEKVGLGDQIHKKPNQMSGGQMQRVAIARALVNNPHILLADEPTGALDSETSVQIMGLLKEIARDKLVIMVTHNPELAEEYSTRIIRLLDGKVIGDTDPYTAEISSVEKAEETPVNERKQKKAKKQKKPSMSFFTALSLSFNNLMTKKARTILTSFAGSIGIIGIALILALSNGIQTYIDDVQEDTLASAPITIEAEQTDMQKMLEKLMGTEDKRSEHGLDKVYSNPVLNELINSFVNPDVKQNNLKDFKAYLEGNPNNVLDHITAINYGYDFDFNVFVKDKDGNIIKSDAMELMQQTMAGDGGLGIDMSMGSEMMMGSSGLKIYEQMLAERDGSGINPIVYDQYETIYGEWPSSYNEVVLVVNSNNEMSDLALLALGLTTLEESREMWETIGKGESLDTNIKSWSYEEICGIEFMLVPSCNFYSYNPLTNSYVDISETEKGLTYMYDNGIKMKVSGIIRPKPDAASAMLTGTVAYTKALTDYVIDYTANSEIVKKQLENPEIDVLTGLPFKPADYTEPTVEEKAEAFAAYVNGLTTEQKAELYKAIASIPSEDYLSLEADKRMAMMDREYIENTMVDAFAAEANMDTETIREYIAKMSDEELMATVRAMLLERIAEAYTAGAMEQFAATETQFGKEVANAQFAAQLDGMMAALTGKNEEIAALYDAHMPPTHSESDYKTVLRALGKVDPDTPSSINIYAATFEAKEIIADEIANYNNTREKEEDQITYTDYVALIMSGVATIINVISYVLIAFVSISLIVSSIMIGIITYISVLERTKEIGILRAIGASKKDIARVFNAEALTIGFAAGLIGVLFTVLFCIPVNAIIQGLSGIESIAAVLPLTPAIVLVLISMFLTFIAGLLPSRIAAKKDPVEALRTE